MNKELKRKKDRNKRKSENEPDEKKKKENRKRKERKKEQIGNEFECMKENHFKISLGGEQKGEKG